MPLKIEPSLRTFPYVCLCNILAAYSHNYYLSCHFIVLYWHMLGIQIFAVQLWKSICWWPYHLLGGSWYNARLAQWLGYWMEPKTAGDSKSAVAPRSFSQVLLPKWVSLILSFCICFLVNCTTLNLFMPNSILLFSTHFSNLSELFDFCFV